MKNRDLVYVALFAAMVAVLGLMPPLYLMAVPITAQSLGVMLAGAILGAKRGGLALGLFVLLVAIGVPVLAGGRGGFGVFLGPSGGFVLAFPIAAAAVGWLTQRCWTRLTVIKSLLINLVGGILVLYAIGVPWLAVVSGLPLTKALIGALSFLPGDLLKAVIAALAAVAVKRTYPLIDDDDRRRIHRAG